MRIDFNSTISSWKTFSQMHFKESKMRCPPLDKHLELFKISQIEEKKVIKKKKLKKLSEF